MSAQERAAIVQSVVSGTLTVREVCERHELSTQCVVDWVTEFRQASLDAFDARLRQTLESQGIAAPVDVAAPHFVVARGELALPDLIQIMALGRRSGVITVAHDGVESRLWCVDGNIIDAESGKLQGAGAVYRVLAVEDARITTSFSAEIDRPTRVRQATMELLLEGARRADECNVVKRALGSGAYRLSSAVPAQDVTLSRAEREALNVFATPTTIAEALAESTLGDLETLNLIETWRSCGHLVAEVRSSRAPTLRPGPGASHEPHSLTLASGVQVRVDRSSSLPAPPSRAPLLRALLLGMGAGLALGLTVWWAMPRREGVLEGASSAGAAGAPRSAGVALAAGALPAGAALAVMAAPPDGRALSDARPLLGEKLITIDPAPRREAAPAIDSTAPPIEPTPIEPTPIEPAAPPIEPTAKLDLSAKLDATAAADAPDTGNASPPAPVRPPRQAATPRGPEASAGAPPDTRDAPGASKGGKRASGASADDSPEAPRSVPRMRIIEEQVPRIRVVD